MEITKGDYMEITWLLHGDFKRRLNLSYVQWYLNEVQSDEEDDAVWYVKKSRSNALVVIN